MNHWDQRYDRDDYLFGVRPNAFLARQAPLLSPGQRALAVADGEGRNGVWLAEQGLDVHAVDGSPVAVEKARRLAASRSVALTWDVADLADWAWPEAAFDVVVAIFIQFAGPDLRRRLFAGMHQALKPGGLLLLEGYGPEQLDHGTGGPSSLENLYTEAQLRRELDGFEIEGLYSYEAVLEEGVAHCGRSALVDCIARKSAA